MNLFYEQLVATGEDGSALTNSVAETSLLPTGRKITVSQLFDYVGRTIKLRAAGRISTVVTTPGTLTLALKFGSTAVFTTGAMTLNTTAQTNTPWILEVDLTLRAISGSAANFMGIGTWTSHAVIGSSAIGSGGAGTQLVPYNAAPAVGSNFDGTAAHLVDFTATWSVANASNSITLHQFELVVPT